MKRIARTENRWPNWRRGRISDFAKSEILVVIDIRRALNKHLTVEVSNRKDIVLSNHGEVDILIGDTRSLPSHQPLDVRTEEITIIEKLPRLRRDGIAHRGKRVLNLANLIRGAPHLKPKIGRQPIRDYRGASEQCP